MARVHLLSCGSGDCTIIQHNSGRVTVIDISGGNSTTERVAEATERPLGNFAMKKHPTNPIEYLHNLGVTEVFRFILTHPDMDHLDGFEALVKGFSLGNFWDSGARKDKPDFKGSPYREEDWDKYVAVRDGKVSGVTIIHAKAGSRFRFANKNEEDSNKHDGLHIVSPSKAMVDDANEEGDDFNDVSLVITYWSSAGKVIIPGDAHDASWIFAAENHLDEVENCAFLLAPHHGRKSDRDFSYLNTLQPRMSLLGSTPSEFLAYSAWRNRDLQYFMQNQAGNVVLDISAKTMSIYVENGKWVADVGGDVNRINDLGYFLYGTIDLTDKTRGKFIPALL